jgi:hypothetical protein
LGFLQLHVWRSDGADGATRAGAEPRRAAAHKGCTWYAHGASQFAASLLCRMIVAHQQLLSEAQRLFNPVKSRNAGAETP